MEPASPMDVHDTSDAQFPSHARPAPREIRPGWSRRLVALFMVVTFVGATVPLAGAALTSASTGGFGSDGQDAGSLIAVSGSEWILLVMTALWPAYLLWLAATILVTLAGTWRPLKAVALLTSPVWLLVGALISVANPSGAGFFLVTLVIGVASLVRGLIRDDRDGAGVTQRGTATDA